MAIILFFWGLLIMIIVEWAQKLYSHYEGPYIIEFRVYVMGLRAFGVQVFRASRFYIWAIVSFGFGVLRVGVLVLWCFMGLGFVDVSGF